MRLSLVLAGLLGSLLAGAPAHAQGSYTGPNLTGGQGTSQGSSPSPYQTLNLQSGPLYGTNVHGTNPSCGGQIEAQWIWTASSPPGPVPQQVIVKQYSSATWASSTATGQCDDALKDSPVTTPPAQPGGDTNSVSSGTHYSVKTADANGNLEVYCTPTASVATGSCGVYYMASASPVFITLTGTLMSSSTGLPVLDSSGNQQVLTGQQITATVQGLSGFQVTKYTWAVGGSTFKNYDPTLPSNQLVPLGPTDLTGPAKGSSTVASLAFYDRAAETLTVSCAVTVLAPDGTSLNLTATSPPFKVYKPTASWGITTGYVQRVHDTKTNRSGYALVFAAGSTQAGGEAWNNVKIVVPAPFTATGGSGCYAQLITPDVEVSNPDPAQVPTFSNNKQQGLDTSYPYKGYKWDVSGPGANFDGPAVLFMNYNVR